MVKFLSSGLPLRRASGLARYGVFAVIILIALYTFSYSSRDLSNPSISLGQPGSSAPLTQPVAKPPVDTTNAGAQDAISSPIPEPAKTQPASNASPSGGSAPTSHGPSDAHPIDKLIYDAQHTFAELTSKESKTLEQAAQAYRKRRGRHPPPNFDKWFEFAKSQNALVVEDFFDQIYHDLGPFWGLEPAVLRRESSAFEMTINIRNGNATAGSNFFWTKIWLKMVKTVEHLLPDMDIALNAMDEPRLVVPWEDVAGYMQKASKTVKIPTPKTVVNEFQRLPLPREGDLQVEVRPLNFEKTSRFHFQ